MQILESSMNRALLRDEGKPLPRAFVSSLGEVATRRVLFGMCIHVRKVGLRQSVSNAPLGATFLGVSFWASAERVQC